MATEINPSSQFKDPEYEQYYHDWVMKYGTRPPYTQRLMHHSAGMISCDTTPDPRLTPDEREQKHQKSVEYLRTTALYETMVSELGVENAEEIINRRPHYEY